MKNVLIITALIGLSITQISMNVQQNQKSDIENFKQLVDEFETSTELTTVSVEQANFDFGDISASELVKTTFKMTNSGKKPLVINEASSTCGCTVANSASLMKKPIGVGETEELEIQFNPKGRNGRQVKQIKVVGNFEQSPLILTIKANVVN